MQTDYADTAQAPPTSFRCDMQPYGPYVIEDCRWGEYNGFPTLSGRVVEGSETSRIFQHTSARSITGQPRTIYGVKRREVEAGECVRIAM